MDTSSSGSNTDEIGKGSTVVEKQYDPSVTSPSSAIIEALESAEDIGATESLSSGNMTLYDYVDLDAVNQLLTRKSVNDVAITFPVNKYTVWIERGRVAVTHTVNTPADLE